MANDWVRAKERERDGGRGQERVSERTACRALAHLCECRALLSQIGATVAAGQYQPAASLTDPGGPFFP